MSGKVPKAPASSSPSFEASFLLFLGVDGPETGPTLSTGVDLFEPPFPTASVRTRPLRARRSGQQYYRKRSTLKTTHLAAIHDSTISSNAAIGRSCPSFALFLQTGHSCFEVIALLMHCTFDVVKKLGLLSSNANPPVSKNSAHTTRKPDPYKILCISCRSTTSQGVPAPSVGSLTGLQCPNPTDFANDSSSTLS